MGRPTGSGKAEQRSNPPSLLIYNFDIDGDELKEGHREALTSAVVPILSSTSGGSVSIVGLASRTGRVAHNDALSGRRARRTLDFLRHAVPRGFPARQVTGFGERKAAQEGVPDGTEDERFRSVVIFTARGPLPPPNVPPVIDVTPEFPELPAPADGPLDTLGKILDVVGFGSSLLELVAAGALVAFAEILGLVTGIGTALLALPAAWLSGDRLARFNGACQGIWNAMQDMANAFSSSSLDSIPESQWPPVPRPRPHLPAVNEGSLMERERQWRQGEREGCQQAYDHIMRLERSPLVRTQSIQGRQRTIRLSGRMLLRVMSHVYGWRVADAVRAETDRRLRSRGRGPWPLIR